ncbi:hypothetical protein [Synechococcus phage Yong-M3-232]|nr:hypothetical protein [Synechococcus phage Yong-M3-232]
MTGNWQETVNELAALEAEAAALRAERNRAQQACEQMGATIVALRAEVERLREALEYAEPYLETLHSLMLQNGGSKSEGVRLCWGALTKTRAALTENQP